MIEELIEARSGSLKLTDWDTPGGGRAAAAAAAAGESSGDGGAAAGGGGDPCQFTADVRKAVTAMHNILQQQLPPEQLQVMVIGGRYWFDLRLFFPFARRAISLTEYIVRLEAMVHDGLKLWERSCVGTARWWLS